MVSSIPQLSLEQIYPDIIGNINLNTCGDPDCGNFGVAPDPCHSGLRGPGAGQRRSLAAMSNPAFTTGLGRYKLGAPSDDASTRVSTAFEYDGNPVAWSDGRVLTCQHQRGNAECDIQLLLLSNLHFEEEVARLRSQNGLLTGPACGACGKPYLDAPEEFIFNGANGKSEGRLGTRSVKPRALGVRLVHKPCKGQKGARFTVSAEHRRQKDRSDNLQILSQLVNGAGINDILRLLFPAKGQSEIGIKRVYDRIFWLERVLLAYEQAQLSMWKKRLKAKGQYRHTHIAHDDVVLGVNWETTTDRRITALNCSVSADIQSGYVFRIDVDFDPTVEPVRYVEDIFLGVSGKTPALRKEYRQSSGRIFTAPLLTFQRPSGGFDEPALFAAARAHLRLFVEKTQEALARSADPITAEVQNEISTSRVHEDVLRIVVDEYFNLPASERDGRNAFSGIMTRDTYTKAAHLACLRDMVPPGKITLVSEQEAAMARVVPHVYRDEILQDRFEWHVVSFDKEATKPTILRRTARFKAAFRTYRQARPDLAPWEALENWTAQHLLPAFKTDRRGAAFPFPISNFASRSWPALWLHSPVQVAGETDKVVGFPLLSPRYRRDYRKLGMQASMQLEADDDLRAAIARRTIAATLQPAATFMNSLRERVSFARRSGGRASRKGPSFVNGACYNPRVLIAALNIYRVHYNFFEKRQYVSPLNRHAETEDVSEGTTTITAPGTGARIKVPKRRTSAPIQRTPAMRAGIQTIAEDERTPALPALKRVLYQPWLFHGTPLWSKLQGR